MEKIIVANWKMNPIGAAQAQKLFNAVKNGVGEAQKTQTIICPPFIYLPLLKGLPLGAQNISHEEKGAFTGEISGVMLADLGVQYVIIGHSEVRRYLHETDETVAQKAIAAKAAGLQPMGCIGESEDEKKEEVFRRQLQKLTDIPDIIIAYEPIWAIGTGKNCSVQEAKESVALIKSIIGKKTPVLYGGSVNSENAKGYLQEPEINGLLIGGASLRAEEFIKIVKISEETQRLS